MIEFRPARHTNGDSDVIEVWSGDEMKCVIVAHGGEAIEIQGNRMATVVMDFGPRHQSLIIPFVMDREGPETNVPL